MRTIVMSLRSRLIVAFFLLSVVPLTAITLYSYRSSADALRTAAELEGRQAARDMSRRMDMVAAGLSEQLNRLWDMPRPPLQPDGDDSSNPRAAAVLARTLGTAAALLDRLEFVPGPPAPPAPPAPPEAPRVSSKTRDARAPARRAPAERAPAHTAGPAAAARQEAEDTKRIVIDIAGAVAEANKALKASGVQAHDLPPWVALMTRGIAQGLQATALATAQGIRLSAEEVQQRAAARGKEWVVHRGHLGVPIERQGRVVGTVTAQLNKEQVMAAVFGEARTDQGEVPFAVDEDGTLFTPDASRKAMLASIGAAGVSAPGTTTVENRDQWLVVKRRDASGVTFGIARPLGDSLGALRRTLVGNLMLGLLVIGVAAIGIIPISGRMTRDLATLASTAAQIAHGNFGVRVPVRSHDEIGRLSAAFNRMAEGVQAHQKLVVEQERLQRELDLCRRIQAEMLPHGALRLGFAEVKGVSIPAREVGGDFFNYFVLDNGDIAVLVGDVSGKGVGAALLMANVQATLRARLPLERNLASLVDAIDREVDDRTPGGVYVTLFIGILETGSRRLRYVNAGHHPQFVLRRGGTLERLPSAGLPVGLYAGHGYREQELALDEGDLIFFYTDGTIETESESGDMFGVERLESLLEISHEGDIDSVLSRVEAALRHFRGKAEPFDDATMMALRLSEGPRVDAAGLAAVPALAPPLA